MDDTQRPSPDSLLNLLSQERSLTHRGRLKIFFGASAGVGKTYAMLSEARQLHKDGLDVVIGVIETHGRTETVELVKDLPILPLKEIGHRGVSLKELDLEAALERKPSLILVDELAHTNAPGSRHPKRWQDVEELLNHGIDVFTTLNVQHLESINDMVAKLTGVQVKETLPDQVLDKADDIALIDIPSDELLKRLKEGKVYIAEGADKRAAEHFFKKTNLVALRELALRRTAERVDAQMDVLTAALGQKEAQIGEKILVCIGHDEVSRRVIRHAKRLATRSRAPWIALYVETSRHDRLNEQARLDAERNLRLAERLGAKVVHLKGDNAAEEILNYALYNGVTRIVIGHRHRARRWQRVRPSLASELIENAGGIEITTVTEPSNAKPAYLSFWKQFFARPLNYLWAAAIMALCTLIGLPFRGVVDSDNLTMIYLTGIVFIAAKLGAGPSVFASLMSVAVFNFFFTVPYYTFSFIDTGYYFTFAVMLITSFLVGSLAAKLAHQARQSRLREQETAMLYNLTRELSSVRGIEAMSQVAIKHIRESFDATVSVFLPGRESMTIIPENSPAREVKEESVARWVLENGQVAGRNTDTMPSAKGVYFPLMAEAVIHGALSVIPNSDHDLTLTQVSRLETFSSLIASAFQRAHRADDAEKARVESESEKLRNVLLSSVSHDLRTPLASITGAASSALMLKEALPKSVIELLSSIHSQATRLARLVTNLLDVTSLEAGKIRLNTQPYFIEEVVGTALLRAQENKEDREITVSVAPHLPLIEMDGLLIEQALVNLLDNAIRYTRENGGIEIAVTLEDNLLHLSVSDNGAGLPPGDEKAVFDKFYTHGHRKEGNAGLGLAICKGIVEAHGGMIEGHNNERGGATIHFTLPLAAPTLDA